MTSPIGACHSSWRLRPLIPARLRPDPLGRSSKRLTTTGCKWVSANARRYYAAAAYLILPRAIRLCAHILNRGRVPSYTLTGDGLPGDPVNLVLIGAVDELRRAFVQAGWTQADPLGIGSSWKMACAFVLNRP